MRILEDKFKIIQNKWIKSLRSGPTGIGYTFETLLDKKEDTFFIADFFDYEIKTHRSNSNSYISLFNATPDGDYLFEIERLKNTYGYPDKYLKEYKILNVEIRAGKYSVLNKIYFLTLKLDYRKQKLILYIKKGSIIDEEISWSFTLLKERMHYKLKTLVFVEADSIYRNRHEFFKYKSMTIYKLRSFEKFLELLEEGKIVVRFKIGVFRSGKRIGQTHDHGTSFSIDKNSLDLLFEKQNKY